MSTPITQQTNDARHATYGGLLRLAMPLILGMAATSLMQFTDRYFLGLLGPSAIAVSFPAGMTAYLLQCLFSASAAYTATFAAQHLGAGEAQKCGGWVWSALWLGMVGAALNLAALPLLPWLFGFTGREPHIVHDMTWLCGWWMSCCLPATMLSGIGGFFAGTERTGMVLALNLVLLTLNAAFNWILIFGHLGFPALGVVGSGVGTFTANVLVAALASAAFLSRGNRARFGTAQARWWDAAQFRRFVRFAWPQGLRTFLEMIAWTFFAFALGMLGTEELAASNIVLNWNLLTFIPMVGLSQAIGVAVGNSIGSGAPLIGRMATRRGLHLELGYAAVVAVALLTLNDALILPFLHLEREANPTLSAERILALCRELLVVAALWTVGDAVSLTYTGALNGAGDTRWPMVAAVSGTALFVVLPLIGVLALPAASWHAHGIEPVVAAWASTVLFVSGIGLVLAWRFNQGTWMRMSVRAA